MSQSSITASRDPKGAISHLCTESHAAQTQSTRRGGGDEQRTRNELPPVRLPRYRTRNQHDDHNMSNNKGRSLRKTPAAFNRGSRSSWSAGMHVKERRIYQGQGISACLPMVFNRQRGPVASNSVSVTAESLFVNFWRVHSLYARPESAAGEKLVSFPYFFTLFLKRKRRREVTPCMNAIGARVVTFSFGMYQLLSLIFH